MTFYFLTLGGFEVLVHWSLTTFPVALWQPAARATKSHGHLNKVSQQLSKRLSVIQNNHQACELWKNSHSPGGNIVKSCNTVKGRLCFFAWCTGLYSDPLNLSWILKTPHSKKLLSQDEEINLFCFFFFFFLSPPNLIRPQKLPSRAGPSKMCLPHWYGSLTFMSGWGLFMHCSSVAFTGDTHYHQVPALCTGDITQSVCLQEMTKEVDFSLSWEIKI